MKKRIICILISSIIALSSITPSLAVGNNNWNSSGNDLAKTKYGISIKEMFDQAVKNANRKSVDQANVTEYATLTNENGEKFAVNMYEYIPETTLQSDDGSLQKTLVFDTSPEYVTPLSVGQTSSHSEYDSSYSVKGYITITYSTRISQNLTEYLLTNVSGQWVISDSSVTLSNRKVYYECAQVYMGTTEQTFERFLQIHIVFQRDTIRIIGRWARMAHILVPPPKLPFSMEVHPLGCYPVHVGSFPLFPGNNHE